jgi:hypothetical protein
MHRSMTLFLWDGKGSAAFACAAGALLRNRRPNSALIVLDAVPEFRGLFHLPRPSHIYP